MTARHLRPSPAGVSRRTFLGAGVAGSAALCTGGFAALLPPGAVASAPADALRGDVSWIEKSIPQLQAMMKSGTLSSVELTVGYVQRIIHLNPTLHAVLEINPLAIAIAAERDAERRHGRVRGPLHGIPILVKDNIATDDLMQTTAGSLALVHSKVAGDAVVTARLRAAGAVVLGKANLGEWANFRGFNPFGFYGWTARGGATRNPYLLSYPAFGSSSGSAVSTAANLCAAAVGTETDGSIVGPSNCNLVVGLKPSLGLVSQAGIIPISHEQDAAGPMCRTVTDAAVMLGVLRSPVASVAGRTPPTDYTPFLRRGSLRGKRIGVDRRYRDDYAAYGYPGDDDTLPFFDLAVATMAALGATIVDTDTGDIYEYGGDEFTALQYEFKAGIEEYLAGVRNTSMRKLGDLIAFNRAHCREEMTYYGQEIFEMSEALGGDLSSPDYIAARTTARNTARSGIDKALDDQDLDAIVAPHLTNTSAPAVAGYPNLALPVGITAEGKPAGMLMYGGFLEEPQLIGLAYDLEQALRARVQPQLLGTFTYPPDAGICSVQAQQATMKSQQRVARARIPW